MKKEILVGNLYQRFIDYALSVCNEVSLMKVFDSHEDENRRIREIILTSEKIDEKELFKNYSEEYLNYIISKYYQNEKIFYKYYIEEINEEALNFDEEIELFKIEFGNFKNFKDYYECYYNIQISVDCFEKLNYTNFFSKIIYDERKIIIRQSIDSYIYECFTNLWLDKNRKDLIKHEEVIMFKKRYGSNYYFKVTPEIKKQLLEYNHIYAFSYPKSLEDICFYKNNELWFSSTSHEKNFFIVCSNQDELEMLKKMGIPLEFLSLQLKDI